MADLFSPFTLKGVTLRNRIGMSPMTQHACEDRSGKMNDRPREAYDVATRIDTGPR